MIDVPRGPALSLPDLLSFVLGSVLFFSTFSIAGTQVSLALALLLWIALAAAKAIPGARRTMLDVPFLCLFAASMAAVLFSAERRESLINCRNLLLIGAVYLLAYTVSGSKQARRLYCVLLVSGTASSVYGISQYLMGKGGGTLGRTAGSFSTAMTFGGVMFILCSLYLSVALASGISKRFRAAAAAAACVAGSGLFLSFTRSSWLGMLASATCILSLLRRRLLIPFAALVAVAVVIMPARFRDRFSSMWDPGYRTNVQRLELLRGGWEIFKDNPVIGVGPRDLADVYRRYMPPGAVHVHGHMHNIFLQVAVTGGAVGLASFCLLIASFFRLIIGNLRRRLPPPERAWVAGSLGVMAGFLVNGLFEWNFGDAEVVTLLYIVIGANMALRLQGETYRRRCQLPAGCFGT